MLKICELASLSAGLMRHAMTVIREVSLQLDKHVQTKGHLDYATEADFRIQGLITAGLVRHWPALAIVGEEAETKLYEADAGKQLDARLDLLPPDFLSRERPFELPVSQLCVWVDPLDGTLDFVKGKLDGVTVLLGVALNGEPELAMIGKPISKAEEGYNNDPRITIASRGQPVFYTWDSNNLVEQPVVRYPVDRLRMGVSAIRTNHAVDRLVEKLGAEQVKLGGFGRKTLEVMAGNIEAFVYLNGKTSRWDSICMEVIGGLIGGVVTSCDLQNYSYSCSQRATSKNSQGVIVARSKEVMDRLLTAKDFLKIED